MSECLSSEIWNTMLVNTFSYGNTEITNATDFFLYQAFYFYQHLFVPIKKETCGFELSSASSAVKEIVKKNKNLWILVGLNVSIVTIMDELLLI